MAIDSLGPIEHAVKSIKHPGSIIVLTSSVDQTVYANTVEGRAITKIFIHRTFAPSPTSITPTPSNLLVASCSRLFLDSNTCTQWSIPVPITEQNSLLRCIYIEQTFYDDRGVERRLLHRGYFEPTEMPFEFRGTYVFPRCGQWVKDGFVDLHVRFSLVASPPFFHLTRMSVDAWNKFAECSVRVFGQEPVEYQLPPLPPPPPPLPLLGREDSPPRQSHFNCRCPMRVSDELILTDNILETGNNMYIAFKDNGHIEYSSERPALGIEIKIDTLRWTAALCAMLKVREGEGNGNVKEGEEDEEEGASMHLMTVIGKGGEVKIRLPLALAAGSGVF
ncbi:hypothetical protein BGW36DRAFT_442798 [Talaromyces proteolyticus]|uniref:Uncharacterized protein n=1 Tax=Talaromyces proteolyticus TaxID=1131652 RepID=A0AAD4PU33_9EURO|nr:uncharacterized protein BGW36DRAFT_442798 [Talaromyces proteolyticus]KAH8688832.1 hypothetical protein BGW36DRAFT_442798 [Talaromyces proteolyticus]